MKCKQKRPRKFVLSKEDTSYLVPHKTHELEKTGEEDNSFQECLEAPSKKPRIEAEAQTGGDCDAGIREKWNIADFRQYHSDDSVETKDNIETDPPVHSINHSEKNCDKCEKSLCTFMCCDAGYNSKTLSNNAQHSLENSVELSEPTKQRSYFEDSTEPVQTLRACQGNLKELSMNRIECSESYNKFIGNAEVRSDCSKSYASNSNQSGSLLGPLENCRNAVRTSEEPFRSRKDILTNPPDANDSRVEPLGLSHSGAGDRAEAESMPIILNVFSLARKRSGPANHVMANARLNDSCLFTPPCSPPVVQLRPFRSIPVVNQSYQIPNVAVNQVAPSGNGFLPISELKEGQQQHVFTPVRQHNYSSQIANGVLPVEKYYDSSSFSVYGNYGRDSYYNISASQSRDFSARSEVLMFNRKSVQTGSGAYPRFQVRPPTEYGGEYRPTNRSGYTTDFSPQFPEYSGVSNAANHVLHTANQAKVQNSAHFFSSVPSVGNNSREMIALSDAYLSDPWTSSRTNDGSSSVVEELVQNSNLSGFYQSKQYTKYFDQPVRAPFISSPMLINEQGFENSFRNYTSHDEQVRK